MGTKVNTNYWGTYDPSSGYYAYLAQYNISDLIRDSKYNPSTPEFDLSVAPWGMGLCNAANVTTALWFRNGTAASTSGNSLVRVAAVDSNNNNTPLVLVTGTKFEYASESGYFRYIQPSQRIGGQTNSDTSNCVISKCKFDLNDRIAGYSPVNTNYLIGNIKPYAYIKYDSAKVRPYSFTWINLNTGVLKTVSMAANSTDWTTFQSDVANLSIDDIAITRIEYAFCSRAWQGGLIGWTDVTNAQIQQLTPIPVDDDLKRLYFSDETLEEYIPLTGVNVIGTTDPTGHETMNGARIDGAQRVPIDGKIYSDCNYKDGQIQEVGNLWNSTLGRKMNHYTEHSWEFDDISYTTKGKIYQVLNNTISYVETGHTFNTDQYYFAIFTEITNSSYNSVADSVKALVLHELAFIGFPIIFERSYYDQEIGTDGVYLPVFDDNLITTGNFVEGEDSLSLPNASWNNIYDTSMPTYDPNYHPSPEPGPTPWDDNPITMIQEGYWTGLGGATYMSSLSDFSACLGDVKSFIKQRSDSLKTMISNAFVHHTDPVECQAVIESYKNQFIYGNSTDKGYNDFTKGGTLTNYTDCVLSVIRYPFDISGYFSTTGTPNQLIWGNVITPISGSGTTVSTVRELGGYNTGQIVQGGSLYIEKKYDNFLNYAPYTVAELYIPYCGSVPIDLEVFAGHTINVKYLIDWFSGSCIALIYRDTVVVDQIPGQIGTSMQIVAEDIQSYQNAMFNGSQTLKAQKAAFRGSVVKGFTDTFNLGEKAAQAVIGGVQGNSSGADSFGTSSFISQGYNTGAAIQSSYQNVKTAQYNLDHTTIEFKQIGTNGPSVSSWNEQVCRLVLYYPTFLEGYNAEDYGHTVGFACLYNTTLDNFSGLTICSSVDTSGLLATEAEKGLLEDALKSGVYL